MSSAKEFSSLKVERIRLVTGTLPQEVRLAFETKNGALLAQAKCATAEKLMPCGMRYPEPMRVRPNFFIPIISVGSYIAPFFILMFVNMNLHCVPGLPKLIQYISKLDCGFKIYGDLGFGLCMLAFIATPMSVGVIAAMFLTRKTNLSIPVKLAIWAAIVFSVCVAECLLTPLGHYTKTN
ncbi:MAG: hypothetical protein K2Y39_12775 [Candidatus Obscuribacterales bacterium]|nr:hypothetical protein [Candidatus Obscuribacterales bacterium]